MQRHALVTGAARGIGRSVAERLRREGMLVTTLDRDEGCDLQLNLAGDPLPEFPDVDVCVSNATINDTAAPAHSVTPEQWGRDLAVNLTGAFRVIQACLPGMRERHWGRIVVVSSGAATTGLPGQVAYSASVAGLLGMMKTVAAENVRRAITANAVLPGMVSTEKMTSMPPEVLERLREHLPSGRMAEPSEVAALVAYLVSEEAGYVTGQQIAIDGGGSLNALSLGSPDRD